MHAQFPDHDLYTLLGLEPKASAEAIRLAYRKLAMAWHPDRNKAVNAELQFKQIRFAYDVLRDTARRGDYDRHLVAHPPRSQNAPQSAAHNPTQTGRAPNLSRRTRITLNEQLHGCNLKLKVTRTEYCSHCEGSGHSKKPPVTCGTCNGAGEVRSALGMFAFFSAGTTPCGDCDGKGSVQAPCSACKGSGVTAKKTGHLKFDVPAGIRPGANLRVRGHGRRGRSSEAAGDLMVRIDLAKHPLFEPDFPHLRCEMPINVFRVLAGGNIAVPTLETPVEVPLNTALGSATELRLAGQGMLDGSTGQRGDLLLKLNLICPQNFSAEQRALLAELERAAAKDPAERDWQRRLRTATNPKHTTDRGHDGTDE